MINRTSSLLSVGGWVLFGVLPATDAGSDSAAGFHQHLVWHSDTQLVRHSSCNIPGEIGVDDLG